MSVETLQAHRTWDDEVVATYEDALRRRVPLLVQDEAGAPVPFDTGRWLRPADAVDETVLDRCVGPTLDIGCGPGRLVRALGRQGVPALGIDLSAAAVSIARTGGAEVVRGSVFDPVPGLGTWSRALLLDGNIGIGADAPRLLARVRDLLAPDGCALIEVDPGNEFGYFTATVCGPGGEPVGSFRWVRIGAAPLAALAAPIGFEVSERWSSGGRCFVALDRC